MVYIIRSTCNAEYLLTVDNQIEYNSQGNKLYLILQQQPKKKLLWCSFRAQKRLDNKIGRKSSWPAFPKIGLKSFWPAFGKIGHHTTPLHYVMIHWNLPQPYLVEQCALAPTPKLRIYDTTLLVELPYFDFLKKQQCALCGERMEAAVIATIFSENSAGGLILIGPAYVCKHCVSLHKELHEILRSSGILVTNDSDWQTITQERGLLMHKNVFHLDKVTQSAVGVIGTKHYRTLSAHNAHIVEGKTRGM